MGDHPVTAITVDSLIDETKREKGRGTARGRWWLIGGGGRRRDHATSGGDDDRGISVGLIAAIGWSNDRDSSLALVHDRGDNDWG